MNTLTIMTYNMLHAPGDRLNELTSVVNGAAPDILACQEITDVSGFLSLCHSTGMHGVLAHANGPEVMEADLDKDLSSYKLEHVGLLSRYPIVRFEAHKGDPRIMFRSLLEAWIEIPNFGLIQFFALHFRAFPGPPHALFKVREAQALSALLRRAGNSNLLCVLGDFNAWVRGEGYDMTDQMTRYPSDHLEAIQGGVTDVILETGLEDVWRKIGVPPEKAPGTLRDRSNSTVDHVFVTPALGNLVAGVELIHDDLSRKASDHFPLLARFVLPN